MHVFALDPFHTGSHRAFVDGWAARSRHDWKVIGLPGRHWKWRMRHSALTLARLLEQQFHPTRAGDAHRSALLVTDMLNVAELRGLLPRPWQDIPIFVYFHENQLTYPVTEEVERDAHFAYTNIVSSMAAEYVWFNSEFHRRCFFDAADAFLRRMPDHQHRDELDRARHRALVKYPGTHVAAKRADHRRPGPIRFVWAARWEHDKNPDLLLGALQLLGQRDVEFRLSVIGENFANRPEAFIAIHDEFRSHLDHWGYVESRTAYEEILADADVFLSTANHEFFGLAAVEALLAGARPLLPDRLAYPEVLSRCLGESDQAPSIDTFLYDGSVADLADHLQQLAERLMRTDSVWESGGHSPLTVGAHQEFDWSSVVPRLDAALEKD